MILAGPDFRVPPRVGELQLLFILLVIYTLMSYSETTVITSWYRDALRNAMVGGVGGSLHVQGLAVDVVIMRQGSVLREGVDLVRGLFGSQPTLNLSYADLANAWRSLGRGFEAVAEGDHLHLELDL